MAVTFISNLKDSVVDSLYNAADWVTDLEDNAMKWAADSYVDRQDYKNGYMSKDEYKQKKVENKQEFKNNQEASNKDYVDCAINSNTPFEVINEHVYDNFTIVTKINSSPLLADSSGLGTMPLVANANAATSMINNSKSAKT